MLCHAAGLAAEHFLAKPAYSLLIILTSEVRALLVSIRLNNRVPVLP